MNHAVDHDLRREHVAKVAEPCQTQHGRQQARPEGSGGIAKSVRPGGQDRRRAEQEGDAEEFAHPQQHTEHETGGKEDQQQADPSRRPSEEQQGNPGDARAEETAGSDGRPRQTAWVTAPCRQPGIVGVQKQILEFSAGELRLFPAPSGAKSAIDGCTQRQPYLLKSPLNFLSFMQPRPAQTRLKSWGSERRLTESTRRRKRWSSVQVAGRCQPLCTVPSYEQFHNGHGPPPEFFLHCGLWIRQPCGSRDSIGTVNSCCPNGLFAAFWPFPVADFLWRAAMVRRSPPDQATSYRPDL